MTDPLGVNLLPASGEWVYDTLPHRAARPGDSIPRVLNLNAAPNGTRTDYSIAIDQLQAAMPGCGTVSLVVAWFGNSTDAVQCRIYPTTNFIGGTADVLVDNGWSAEPWRCSGLTQASAGLIPLSSSAGNSAYGGTPSDPAIVRCIRDLKARGLRVTFYPFILMDAPGYPWRGRIAYTGADITQAASDAVTAFLGPALPSQFSRDTTNLTVGYSGSAADYSFRRMILHYANLCVVAGGVDLFLIGSEFRGLEAIRGPGWTRAGTLASDGTARWDYPFVTGLGRLADDVRGIFDAAALPRDRARLKNLIAYSADWSDWMGVRHADASGLWPHLDTLYAQASIDLVSFDNYLPLSDWTSTGGLDAVNWSAPAPASWPSTAATMNGLGLTGTPSLANLAYLKANIEGGEAFDWFYANGANLGRGLDPAGSDLQVSLPAGDRVAQARNPYAANQSCWRPSRSVGGGTIDIRRSTTPAMARAPCRTARPPPGFRSRRRSPSPSTGSRPATGAPTSPTSSTIRDRARASRPIGRPGTEPRARSTVPVATICWPASRGRRSSNIGPSTGTMP